MCPDVFLDQLTNFGPGGEKISPQTLTAKFTTQKTSLSLIKSSKAFFWRLHDIVWNDSVAPCLHRGRLCKSFSMHMNRSMLMYCRMIEGNAFCWPFTHKQYIWSPWRTTWLWFLWKREYIVLSRKHWQCLIRLQIHKIDLMIQINLMRFTHFFTQLYGMWWSSDKRYYSLPWEGQSVLRKTLAWPQPQWPCLPISIGGAFSSRRLA